MRKNLVFIVLSLILTGCQPNIIGEVIGPSSVLWSTVKVNNAPPYNIYPIRPANNSLIFDNFSYSWNNGKDPNWDNVTYQFIVDSGFVDVWTRNLLWWNEMGYTSGFEADLLNGPWLDDPNDTLEKRIDLIFVRSNVWYNNWQFIGPVFAVVVGDNPHDMTPTGLWPSDHAGVVARLTIPR